MTIPFDALTAAVNSARSQFSVIHGKQEDNVDLIKELSKAFIGAISDLVHAAGGDNDYLEPWVDGIANDIDMAFAVAMQERHDTVAVFKARRGLSGLLARGTNLHAAE